MKQPADNLHTALKHIVAHYAKTSALEREIFFKHCCFSTDKNLVAKHLNELLADLPLHSAPTLNTPITGLCDDSRKVTAGVLFIVRTADGTLSLNHVQDAIAKGAAALLLSANAVDSREALADALATTLSADLPEHLDLAILDHNTAIDQSLCATLAARFYDQPQDTLQMIGITGTNGKTTVASLTQQLLQARDVKTGLIGTVSLDVGNDNGPVPATLTTPGALELYALLARMRDNGCKACVMEVSSHALDQGRVAGLTFVATAFTNLTGDHLDYHGTMDAYAQAKATLFTLMDSDGLAVVNADDDYSATMVEHCPATVLWASCATDPAHQTDERPACLGAPKQFSTAGTTCMIAGLSDGAPLDVHLPLAGAHNVMNALQAAALANHIATPTREALIDQLQNLRAVPGRLELVTAAWPEIAAASSQPTNHPTVLVDYAHTHDALSRVCEALKPLCEEANGKLIVVFGCGGDRDKTKRPKMAQAACAFGDHVVVTSDNPRTEDPLTILEDIKPGLDTNTAHSIEVDRTRAIAQAIAMASPNDTVLIAGKGHEDYQIIGTEKIHFDDREQAAKALQHVSHTTTP